MQFPYIVCFCIPTSFLPLLKLLWSRDNRERDLFYSFLRIHALFKQLFLEPFLTFPFNTIATRHLENVKKRQESLSMWSCAAHFYINNHFGDNGRQLASEREEESRKTEPVVLGLCARGVNYVEMESSSFQIPLSRGDA